MISVIIPCYNCNETIVNTLKTISNQTYKDWECILINDGSEDNTEEIIKGYIKSDNRFKYFKQNNKGASSARNLGITVANGDYIYFVDADDLLKSNAFSSLLSLTEDYIDIVIGKAAETNGQNTNIINIIENSVEELNVFKNIDKHLITIIVEHLVSCVVWNKLYRKSFLIKHNITFKEGIIHEDELWFFETFFHAKDIVFNNEITYFYNVGNTNSISKNLNENSIESYITVIKTIFNDYYLNAKHIDYKDIIAAHITNMKIRFFLYNFDKLEESTKSKMSKKISNSFKAIRPWRTKDVFSKELERNHRFYRKIQVLEPEDISLALYLYPYTRVKRRFKKNLLILKARKKRHANR